MPKLVISQKSVTFWLAVIFTLAAGGGVYFALYQLYQPEKILVPSRVIEERELISGEVLKEEYVSRRDKHPLAVEHPNQLIGKFADVKLYPGEQILTERLVSDPDAVTGIFTHLEPHETYLTFSSNEAKWSSGINKGDRVTVIAIMSNGYVTLGQNIKIINVDEPSRVYDPLKTSGSDVRRISLVIDRNMVGPFLNYKSKSKELHFIPEHPNYVASYGGEDDGDEGDN